MWRNFVRGGASLPHEAKITIGPRREFLAGEFLGWLNLCAGHKAKMFKGPLSLSGEAFKGEEKGHEMWWWVLFNEKGKN